MTFSRLTALYANRCEWSPSTEMLRPNGPAWTADGGYPGRLTADSGGITYSPKRIGTRRGLVPTTIAWNDVSDIRTAPTWRVGALLEVTTVDGGVVVFGLARGGKRAERAIAELTAARDGKE
jgi:hypothetical protein